MRIPGGSRGDGVWLPLVVSSVGTLRRGGCRRLEVRLEARLGRCLWRQSRHQEGWRKLSRRLPFLRP